MRRHSGFATLLMVKDAVGPDANPALPYGWPELDSFDK